jgi:hypothetical protein
MSQPGSSRDAVKPGDACRAESSKTISIQDWPGNRGKYEERDSSIFSILLVYSEPMLPVYTSFTFEESPAASKTG